MIIRPARRVAIGIFTALVAACAMLIAAGYQQIPFLSEAGAIFLVVLLMSLYLFHALGVPGLLEHGGYCGWGLCAPTAFGWIFLATTTLLALWLLAWALASVFNALRRTRRREA